MRKEIDFASVEVRATTTDGEFLFTGSSVNADNGDYDIETVVTDVERIDLREYATDRDVYVVDSYELLEGGQGDLGNMFYVTTLGHATFDLSEGKETAPVSQVLSDDGLLYDANIYYHGHHTDFDRAHANGVSGWTAVGTAAALSAADNGHGVWQDHDSMFFAWYDPDAEGSAKAYEIAVKYDTNDKIWRIANKAFDTFSNIVLSQEDADTLNAMSHSNQNGDGEDFAAGDDIRVYLGAAYQDITNVINSNDDVSFWNFSQDFTTSRSTYYIEIPNGTSDATQQVKVYEKVESGCLRQRKRSLLMFRA